MLPPMKTIMIIILIVSISFIPHVKVTANETPQHRSVIISEVQRIGSSFGSTDEWLELYNTTTDSINLDSFTLFGAGNTTRGLKLTGIISPFSYFLIAKQPADSANTSLATTPDLVLSSLTIPNTATELKLQQETMNEIRIEDTFLLPDSAQSGERDTTKGIYMSLIRDDNGIITPNHNKINLKKNTTKNNICQQNFGTPKSSDIKNENNEQQFLFTDFCFDSITPQPIIESDSVSFQGKYDKQQLPTFYIKTLEDAPYYNVQYNGKLHLSQEQNSNFLKVSTGNETDSISLATSNSQIMFKPIKESYIAIYITIELSENDILELESLLLTPIQDFTRSTYTLQPLSGQNPNENLLMESTTETTLPYSLQEILYTDKKLYPGEYELQFNLSSLGEESIKNEPILEVTGYDQFGNKLFAAVLDSDLFKLNVTTYSQKFTVARSTTTYFLLHRKTKNDTFFNQISLSNLNLH